MAILKEFTLAVFQLYYFHSVLLNFKGLNHSLLNQKS